MNKIERRNLVSLLQAVAEEMSRREEELCAMDARLGDGDLGLTMKKGFGAFPEIAAGTEEENIGKVFMKCGMELAEIIPSTMGFLMSAGLMAAGKAVKNAENLDGTAYAEFVQGFAEGIARRGKCQRGERTILDAIGAGADAGMEMLRQFPEASLQEVSKEILHGAERGVEATKTMIPKYGKAAVHRKDAEGVPDQGACAGMYLLSAIDGYVQSN